MKIVREVGIEEMLKKHLADMESMEIIAIVVSRIAWPLSLASIDTWLDSISPSRTMNVGLKSQRISGLLDRIVKSGPYT